MATRTALMVRQYNNMLGPVRGVVRFVFFLLWCLVLVPPYLLIYPVGWHMRRPMVKLWHRGVCVIAGIRVRQTGFPCRRDQVLLVGNHVSYLDIPVLASRKDVTFVAKADVATWPLFGFLAKIAQTVFIERKRSEAARQKQQLQARIKDGEHLAIFPEGTSSDGNQVLPFKTALFQIVMDGDIRESCHIQPVTIACRRDAADADLFSWHGDMTLLPHLWTLFCSPGLVVDLCFHPPALASNFEDRKALARWAEQNVQQGLARLRNKTETPSQQNHQAAVIKMQAE